MSDNCSNNSTMSSISQDDWDEVETWHELVHLNRRFLNGETNETPYYRGAIDDETLSLIPDLLKMHDYGFFTTQSQPALESGPGQNLEACCGAHKFWHCKQKAFLSFLIPRNVVDIKSDVLEKFCDRFCGDDRFFTSILSYDKICGRVGCCTEAPKLRSNFPEKWETHLTGYTKSRKHLDNIKLNPRRHIELWCSGILDVFPGTADDVVKGAKPLIVHLLAKDFESVSLAGLVVDIAAEVGMKPEFAEVVEKGDQESESENGDKSEGENEGLSSGLVRSVGAMDIKACKPISG